MSATNDDGYGLLQEVEFFEGEPPEPGYYLVARYRSSNNPRGAGEFLGVDRLHWDGRRYAVDWQSDYYIENRYWAYPPNNPEIEQ